MRHLEAALSGVSSAVFLVLPARVLVALLAEVRVGPAPEARHAAAEVALELDVTKTVLLAHELFADAQVIQTARLAHELLLFHLGLANSTVVFGELLALAVDIAAKERVVAATALIELADVQSVLSRLVVEAVAWVFQPLHIQLNLVELELFEGVLAQLSLEDLHRGELLTNFRNLIRCFYLLLAAGAVHKVEGNALRAPPVSQELSDAVRVEDVLAVQFDAGLLAKRAVANLALVELGYLVGRPALDLEAGQVRLFALTLASATNMSAIEHLATGLDLSRRFELRDAARLGEHHREELRFLLPGIQVVVGDWTLLDGKVDVIECCDHLVDCFSLKLIQFFSDCKMQIMRGFILCGFFQFSRSKRL